MASLPRQRLLWIMPRPKRQLKRLSASYANLSKGCVRHAVKAKRELASAKVGLSLFPLIYAARFDQLMRQPKTILSLR